MVRLEQLELGAVGDLQHDVGELGGGAARRSSWRAALIATTRSQPRRLPAPVKSAIRGGRAPSATSSRWRTSCLTSSITGAGRSSRRSAGSRPAR